MDTDPQKEMPRYKCHKEVHALKIQAVGRETIIPANEGYAPFHVGEEFLDRHNPEAGDYYVVYKDGYKSCSPGKAFEEGYTLI